MLMREWLHATNAALYPADFVLEGRAVSFDGEGALITTEQRLFNRNMGLDKAGVEAILYTAFSRDERREAGIEIPASPVCQAARPFLPSWVISQWRTGGSGRRRRT
jgi:hypothetical protein